MPNILICDDESDIVNALRIYLSDPDYTLFSAENGKEAVRMVRENEIQLVLLDIMMPEMDGMIISPNRLILWRSWPGSAHSCGAT